MSPSLPPRAQLKALCFLLFFTAASYSPATANEKKEVKIFETDDKLADAIANSTMLLSKMIIKKRDAFTVVLSGGYLINKLRKLVKPPYVEEVNWKKWHIFWVDERVVSKTNADSNYKLAHDGFLSKVPILEAQIYAINDTLGAAEAADDYEARLKELVKSGVLEVSRHSKFPRFDLMLLGLGHDGHIASLFPNHPLLKEKKRWVAYITDSPEQPPARITFTLPVIDASAYVFMVISGKDESLAAKTAIQRGSSPSSIMPMEMVKLKQGKFIWFINLFTN